MNINNTTMINKQAIDTKLLHIDNLVEFYVKFINCCYLFILLIKILTYYLFDN